MVSQSKPEIMSAISESGTSSRSMDSQATFQAPVACPVSGSQAGNAVASLTMEPKSPPVFSIFEKVKLSAMSVPPLPR